jgi:hypothetical protein
LTKDQMARLDMLWTEAREKTTESKNRVKYYVLGKESPILRSREMTEEKQ